MSLERGKITSISTGSSWPLVREIDKAIVTSDSRMILKTVDEYKEKPEDGPVFIWGPFPEHFDLFEKWGKEKSTKEIKIWLTEQFPPLGNIDNGLLRIIARLRYSLHRSLPAEKDTQIRGPRYIPFGAIIQLMNNCPNINIYTFSELNQAKAQRMGIKSAVVPFGYSPVFGSLQKPWTERNRQGVFLGTQNSSSLRRPRIEAIEQIFRMNGVHLVYPQNLGDYLWGAERTKVLNESQIGIVMGFRQTDDAVFRLMLYSANGSIPVGAFSREGAGFFRPGIDCVSVSDEKNIATEALKLLDDRKQAEAIQQSAWEQLQKHSLDRQIKQIFP